MLNALVPLVQSLRGRFPSLYHLLARMGKRFFGRRLGIYPRILANEIKAVTAVLESSEWNMAYGRGLVHERLEAEFADYVGVSHAVAVSSGGMAIQMSLRALGVAPGDEVIHQVDTCSATALAVMNAGASPVFADISPGTFMLDPRAVSASLGPSTKAIIATHMWGNPEDMASLRSIARSARVHLLEDACLALGAVVENRSAGALGDVGLFSFGCIKPIQGGEGGMIVTNDEGLARELRSMRHWGDRTIDFGVRDVTQLSWNGRMSEIVAAVVREQLRGYPQHLATLRSAVADFADHLKRFGGIRVVLGNARHIGEPVYAQLVLGLDGETPGEKASMTEVLRGRGVQVWHANFELINSLSLFRTGIWRKWLAAGDLDRLHRNYTADFPQARNVFLDGGLGLGKMNFLSAGNLKNLKTSFDAILQKRP
jgi:perosamine synthetase